MSRIMFVRCNTEGCESESKPFPVAEGSTVKKCAACDSEAHKRLKQEARNKLSDFHNPPPSEKKPDVEEAPAIPVPLAIPVVAQTEVKMSPQEKAALTKKKKAAAARAIDKG